MLWCAVNAIIGKYDNAHCVIYTGDIDANAEDIVARAKDRFGTVIDLTKVSFVFVQSRGLIEATKYPRFTMLGQAIGSIILGWEALCLFKPDLVIDSMGYAFTFPLFRYLGGCRVGCYVHYPTISTDMLARVSSRESQFNNDSAVSKSAFLTSIKVVYYQIFAWLYGLVGSCAEVILVNSTWTKNHIVHLWRRPDETHVVYPPCDTFTLEQLKLQPRKKEILSVAQFRPEKNHGLQLEAFRRLLDEHPEHEGEVKLVLLGSCRNEGDQSRVNALKKLRSELHIAEDSVEFRLNVPYKDLQAALGQALIGLHTMRDEHFGIGVVEFLASGAIALAHDSAGPRMDIVIPYEEQRTGLLASDAKSYADAMHEILSMDRSEQDAIQTAARVSVSSRFSEAEFETQFLAKMESLLESVLL